MFRITRFGGLAWQAYLSDGPDDIAFEKDIARSHALLFSVRYSIQIIVMLRLLRNERSFRI